MGDLATTTAAAPDQAALATAAAAAVKADRDRRKEIMALEETAGREALATHFADNTDMAVDAVKAALATAPKGTGGAAEQDNPGYDAARADAAAGAGLAGAGTARPPAAAAAKAGWDRAAERINARSR